MFGKITPEAAGIRSADVEKYIRYLERHGNTMHSVLMMRGNDVFAEYYWAPFDADFRHRMYSQTKSFVGVAIGLLEEEGKLSLDDKLAGYFADKIDGELPPELAAQTIRDTLMMCTSCHSEYWFTAKERDRTRLYFNGAPYVRPNGTIWEYDSPGSQVLCVLVERLSGMTLLEYLKKKLFNEMGAFQTAEMLRTPSGESWGDSAMLCTTRDIASFGRFVMNYGVWEGKRLMNEEYLKTATSALTDNDESGFCGYHCNGYGYQIWRTERNGFAFVGMGNQLTICLPDYDFIFVCTADDQGNLPARQVLMNGLFDLIVDSLHDSPLPENEAEYASLCEYTSTLKLRAVHGDEFSSWAKKINGKVYVCDENKQGIKEFSFKFGLRGAIDGENGTENGAGGEAVRGEFRYVNAQGEKVIPFGIKYNEFFKFPQFGYSDDVGGERTTNGFMYKAAASGAWRCENKLVLRVQIIDRYFGNFTAFFGFRDDLVAVNMVKTAEDFLSEYEGAFVGRLKH